MPQCVPDDGTVSDTVDDDRDDIDVKSNSATDSDTAFELLIHE